MERNKSQRCPSAEELDDFCRAESRRLGSGSPDVSAHLDGCEACRGAAAKLRRLQAALTAMMEPPEGLADRVKAAVRSGRAPRIPEASPRPFGVWFWRAVGAVAACVVVVFALSALLRPKMSVDGPGEVAVNAPGEMDVATASAPQGAREQEAPAPVSGEQVSAPNGPVMLAGVRRDAPAETAPARPVIHLPGQLRHVWTVKDLESARLQAVGFMKGLEHARVLSVGEKSAVLMLPDRSLQSLVDAMSAAGWSLVSGEYPQPQKGEQVHFDGHPVVYEFSVVQENN